MEDESTIKQEFNNWWHSQMVPLYKEMPWLKESEIEARKNLAEAAWFGCARLQFTSSNH